MGPTAIPRRRRDAAYRLCLALVLLGVAGQFYLSNLLLYGVSEAHRIGGWLLMIPALLAAVFGIAQRSWRSVGVGLAVLLMTLLQPVIVFELAPLSPYLGALHPLNGFLVGLISGWALLDAGPDSASEFSGALPPPRPDDAWASKPAP